MKERVKVAFASGSDELIPGFLDRMEAIFPELPLYVVSEFQPKRGKWIPYHIGRTFADAGDVKLDYRPVHKDLIAEGIDPHKIEPKARVY